MSDTLTLFNTLSSYVSYRVRRGCPETVGIGQAPGGPRKADTGLEEAPRVKGQGKENGRTWARQEALPGAHAVPSWLRVRACAWGGGYGGNGRFAYEGCPLENFRRILAQRLERAAAGPRYVYANKINP